MKIANGIISLIVLLSLPIGSAFGQGKLHENAAEGQASAEMAKRLRSALKSGDISVCKREGGNMARYGKSAAGEALISADLKAVNRQISEIQQVFDKYRQIQDLNSKRAVEQSYALIRHIAVKMTEDAITEVSLTLVTAPLPGAGKMVSEMGKQASDFLGNFNDAHKLVNRARALRQFDALARHATEQMQSLKPAMRELMNTRTVLSECRQQFQNGASSEQRGNAAPSSSGEARAESGSSLLCTCEDWNHDGLFGVVLNGSILFANYGPYEKCMVYARGLDRCQAGAPSTEKQPVRTTAKNSCTCEDWNRDGRFGIVLNGKTILSPNIGPYATCMSQLNKTNQCKNDR